MPRIPTSSRPVTVSKNRMGAAENATRISIHLPHPERICKLDANECVHRPAKTVIDALHFWADRGTMQWYPDCDAVRLRTALAEYTRLPFSCIRVFNGADEALSQVIDALVGPESEVILAPPTYDRIHYRVECRGGAVKKVLLPHIFDKDLDMLIQASGPKTRMVYLANPNNPTGVMYSPAEIEAILRQRPNVNVLIDEAYFEFSKTTVASLIKKYPRLLVVRSFAPAFGLAGLRLGYLLARPETLEKIERAYPTPMVSMPAQIAGTAALKSPDDMESYVATVKENMDRLREIFTSMGLQVTATPANFILVRVARPAATTDYLAGKLIFVRNCDTLPGLEGCLRITVGDDRTTARLLTSFLCMPKQLLGPGIGDRRITLTRPAEETPGKPQRARANRARFALPAGKE